MTQISAFPFECFLFHRTSRAVLAELFVQTSIENEIKPLVEQFMKERGLELSQEKTHITHITNGFDFLGQHIRKYKDGKVLVKPSKKNVKAFLAEIQKPIKENAQATAGNLIVQLNLKIRGWTNYHRHVSSKQTFVKVDNAIY